MLNYKELQEEIKIGDYVQIITASFNGGVGKLDTISSTYLKVVPIDDEELDAESGSINHTILFPLHEIKLIIKVNMEVIKKDANENV